MTEELKYVVVKKFPTFEIRRYPDYVLAQVSGTGDFNAVSYRAFSPLFNYISGQNSSNSKIAMTAPVIQETLSDKNHVVSFVLPESIDLSKIPIPANSIVNTKIVAAHDAAVLKFGGSWSTKLLASKEAELRKLVADTGLETAGNIYFARFDPPWKPWFLKRNEVMIALAKPFN